MLRFAALTALLCLTVRGQEAQSKDAAADLKGLPPRAAPSDYQAQGKAGTVTIAAEFKAHSVPTMEGILTTEDFVVVEAGFYGAPDAKLTLSPDDFSLRINGKKMPSPSQPYGVVIRTVKDPDWAPPTPPESKGSKTKLNTGGGDSNKDDPPPIVHIPIEVQRAMAQRVQKASMPLGDRPLPQAGLLYFEYGSNSKNIKSLELIYNGAAGKATLTLQP
jgi:hypothetical protein